jgi:DNA invertase Pin-like site-specific DNA recombinase
MVQLAGHDMLKARGVTLIAAGAPRFFVEDTPTAVLVRQVLGAVVEFEKTTLVAKLAAARRRKRMATGKKVEGRKSHAEKRPEIVALADPLEQRIERLARLSIGQLRLQGLERFSQRQEHEGIACASRLEAPTAAATRLCASVADGLSSPKAREI